MTLHESKCIGYNMSIEDFLDSLIPEVPQHIPEQSSALTADQNIGSNGHNDILDIKDENENSVDSETFFNRFDSDLESICDNDTNVFGHHIQNNQKVTVESLNFSRHFMRNDSSSSTSSGVTSPPLSPECQETPFPTSLTATQLASSNTLDISTSTNPDLSPFAAVVDQASPSGHLSLTQSSVWDLQKANERNYRYDPKPLMRKNKRQLVPSEEKNHKYWQRRQRNNKAARKSREDRRKKELEVLQTMNVLQDENQNLKMYMSSILKINEQLQLDVIRMRQKLEQAGFFIPQHQQY